MYNIDNIHGGLENIGNIMNNIDNSVLALK